ncbi:aspartate-semialdehyde dehydrogenase [Fodinisporobacter ferrooxydans]|uniref:Aspartate-semialdehyde dehydrogenase n=1 Tax=Fodinisporobacter ferrooxydans TaxID=2901836 RepID=A0ABY4CFY9_9BACL|nr:aspartate-semialdehyde dehydrogenase [Alicyclobacillaceae bacterium MYW30-H2]
MERKERYNVAVVGATGAVGQKMIQTLEDRNFPVEILKPLASARSVGQFVSFHGQQIAVEEATPEAFEGIDFALFSAGGSVSLRLAPEAAKRGAIVIDNTSAFRMDPNVPLVVPEVNAEAIAAHNGIIANPNCSTIQMVVALKPIYDAFGIDKIVVSTYQAVSGAGQKAIDELEQQVRGYATGELLQANVLPVSSLPVHHQIAFNAIPQIDVFEENGYTKEEMKMVNETKKIFNDPTIQVTPTAVRIPVVFGHSESVFVKTKRPFTMDAVRELLEQGEGIVVVDDPASQKYPLATEAAGKREVFVGRLRKDLWDENAFNMWVVSDNVLKGAAWNAVQIAETIISDLA